MQCAWGYMASQDPALLACVEHGVRFLLEHHKSSTGGYAWELEITGPDGVVHRHDEINREGKIVVLLIDELNKMGVPLDAETRSTFWTNEDGI